MFEMKVLHNRNSHVPKLDMSDLIDSNVDLLMYLNENFNMVHENFNI